MTSIKLLYNFLIIAVAAVLTCNTIDPPLALELKLELEDVSCTEAWITLIINNVQLPAEVVLYKNNTAQNNILCYGDTLLYIDSLLPNQTYLLKAASTEYGVLSNEISVTTMDTTNHNFSWQSFEFGQHSSSVLYDCTIISSDNIWCVGEIYMNDSLGQPDPLLYNAVHWDGNQWELKRITVNFRGFLITTSLQGIFAFSPTQIWLAGGLAIFGDGTNWTPYDVRLITGIDELSLSKAWGSNPDNMYFVGRNGSIAHYNGSPVAAGWTRIESGTALNIGNIWGISDRKGGHNKYLAAGDAMLILNQENEVTFIDPEPNIFINSLWGITNNLIYTAGNGVVLFRNNKWEKIDRPDVNTIYSIRGNNFNNVFGISSAFSVIHFNGLNWQFINEGDPNIYYRLEIKNDLIAAVGWLGDKAVITLLKRNN
jgi:hypothetical protein